MGRKNSHPHQPPHKERHMNQQPHADIDYDPNADTILSAHDWAINTDMTVTEYATNIQAFRNETLQDWEATTPDELRHMADHIRHDYADTLDAIASTTATSPRPPYAPPTCDYSTTSPHNDRHHKEHPMGKPQEQPDMIHTGDTHYEQARAHRIAHDLLTAAAQALMHGTPPHYPRLNRADPYSDAVTATILHQLATTTTTTKEEQ